MTTTVPSTIRPAFPEPRLQLAVTYVDHYIGYYTITAAEGWRIDNASRCIIIGRGIPREYVPLDTVRSFAVEKVGGTDD